ncbi:MAG: T9SS type A sorting domain-containing protein [Bacteroidetes bacterium]|nr:T9SS type A sorting domain-containing protein [Bacteroidota bacterium]
MNFKATTFPTNALESNHPEWQFYPNPTSGILRIDGEESDLQVQLYTIRGELLNSTLTNHTLDLNHLPNGLYILHIISGKNHSIKKIIKE